MDNNVLKKLIGSNVSVFVRYGFKKKVEETQSYQGVLKSVDNFGVMIERKISDTDSSMVNDFFPWHNIDAIRHRID